MNAPLVSVIIPNYNYAKYLPERIDSILQQTFQDFEIIILDDCSTDASRQVIERYRSNPKVSKIVYNEVNSGCPFMQWEKGLSMAAGKYAWIAEADDVAEPDFLACTVAAMESDPQVAMALGMSKLIDSNGGPSPHEPFESYQPDNLAYIYRGQDYLRYNMFEWNHCYNASMILMRIDVWRSFTEKPYMNMRYVGDWLFWGMMMNGHKIAEIRRYISRFRLHGKSVTDGGRKDLRSRVEGEITKYLFYLCMTGKTFGEGIFHKYQVYKHSKSKRLNDVFDEVENIYPNFWKNVGITRRNYSFFWLYKHTMWLLEKRLIRLRNRRLHPLCRLPLPA
jgi:glycosyltransferase involved in cell wall biosynthesis